jgi:glycosyltransferase involved in cell wall biosynthesis
MRIGIDIRSTLKKRTGIGQYTLNLINHLAQVDCYNSYFLYSKKKIFDRKRKLPRLPGENFVHIVDYFHRGPGRAMKKIDIFHSSSFDLDAPKDSKLVLTIHDVIIKAYPLGHTKDTIETVDRQLRSILQRVDLIIATSHSTKDDLLKWYAVNPQSVHVVYPGVNDWIVPESDKKKEYLLFVGTLEPRKNVEGLIRAYSILKKDFGIDNKLVVIGMKGWMYDSVFKLTNELGLKSDIIFKGYVASRELSYWYNKALVFVYPSFYEGFGLPIIEAFKCGAPVITSNVSSCAEVADGAAILIDPDSPQQIARAMADILFDRTLREDLIRKGIERSKEFDWDTSARKILEIFRAAHST